MPKIETNATPEVRSAFFERRRLRRIRMIVELTHNLISSDMTVSHREAPCLINCARQATPDRTPALKERYERLVRPHFESVIAQRWPNENPLGPSAFELVN